MNGNDERGEGTAIMAKDRAQVLADMRYTIRSACWGAISQIMVKDSSVVIIFASLLGASEMTAVLSTSLQDIAICLFMLPLAALSDRLGIKRQIVMAIVVSTLALLGVAASPWAGRAAGSVMILALCVFSLAISAYTSAWFPLLENVVPAEERGLFFGRLRFSWQLVSAVFIFGSAWFVGRYASISRLQWVITAAALAGIVRIWYIMRIDLPPPCKVASEGSLLKSVRMALGNRQLTGFSIYLFFLYAAANGTMPVVYVFARNYLKLPDDLVVMLSAVTMVGLISGFLAGGRFVHHYGVKRVFLGSHIGFVLLNLMLLGVRGSGSVTAVVLGIILFFYGFLFAGASIAVSSQLLALAQPSNKAVSIAFGYIFYSGGLAISRVVASLALGSGLLAQEWQIGSVVFTRYHSLFLVFGIGVLYAMLLLVLIPGMVREVKRYPVT